jgi:hypothetical protein
MKTFNATDIANKHAQRTTAAIPDYVNGVKGVTVAPGQKAAAAQQKWITNLQESATSGRWARRISAVPLEEWKAAAAGKGAQRIAAGVEAGKVKMAKFMTNFIPHLQQVQSELANMPSTTLEDNLQRMVVNARRNHEFKNNQ